MSISAQKYLCMIGHLIFLITFVKILLNILVIMSKKEVIFVYQKESSTKIESLTLHQERSGRKFNIEVPVLYPVSDPKDLLYYINLARNKRANLVSVSWFNPLCFSQGTIDLGDTLIVFRDGEL